MKNVYLSKQAGISLIEYLTTHGFRPQLMTGEGTPVYHAISTHADIHLCRMGVWENTCIFTGNTGKLQTDYPGNIIYNAVCTGKYFIHNLKYTDPGLLQAVRKWHRQYYPHETLQLIDVPQGYTRCCCLPVDDTSFITSDMGIAKALASYDTDVLLIERGHILLPGFDYGFIGGCGGNLLIPQAADQRTVDKRTAGAKSVRTVVFNGNLEAHPDHEKIAAFVHDRNIDLIYFKDYPLTDIGSILAE